MSILSNTAFAAAYERMKSVTLNPRRHTAPDAWAHSEAVAALARELALANGRSEREVALLEDLGRVHDLGKITGTANPERSLEVLAECGIDDLELLGLVRWHDTNLPWSKSAARGQPPSPKAWARLAREVDLGLLALFMVADRVDCVGGWRRNQPLTWFLERAQGLGLLGPLTLDLPGRPSEICAGGAVVRRSAEGPEVLLIRVRPGAWELPKGGIEWDELPQEAAVREAREETGVEGPLRPGRELGALEYPCGDSSHLKRVRYFALHDATALGALPARTAERRWAGSREAAGLPLVSEDLRPILLAALVAPEEPGR